MSPRINFHLLCIYLFVELEFGPHLRQLIWRVTTHPPTLLPEHPHTYAESQATGNWVTEFFGLFPFLSSSLSYVLLLPAK